MRPPSPKLRAHLSQYAQSHQNPVNRALHFAGIPMLMTATLGLLAKAAWPGRGVAGVRPDAAWPALLASGAWYWSKDRRMSLPTAALFAGCYALGRRLPARALAGLFVTGAAAHAIGHYGFEHKPPAFLSRPEALLEAPAWLLANVAGSYGRDGARGVKPRLPAKTAE